MIVIVIVVYYTRVIDGCWQELAFWELYETEIEACCWGTYSKHLDHKQTLANLDSTFSTTGIRESEVKKLSRLKQFQAQVWNHLEYPSTSRGAKVSKPKLLLYCKLLITSNYFPSMSLQGPDKCCIIPNTRSG